MELLDDLLALLQGTVEDKETLQGIIDSEGLEVLYESVDPDAFPTVEEYMTYFGELQKKKEETGVTPVISPEGNTESNTQTPQVEGAGSSDSSPTTVDVPEVDVPEVDVPETNIDVSPNIEGEEIPGILDPTTNSRKLYEIVDDEIVILGDDGMPKNDKEDETWLEESWLGQAMDWAFDDTPIFGVLSADFWGDIYRAVGNGFTKGQSVDDSIALFAKGKNISPEELQNYIAAVKKSENVNVSDEMKSFQKIYDENGGGFLGFMLGFGRNLSIAPELLIDAMASMLNPGSLAASGAGAAVGAGAGAALTSIGGPLALFGAGAGGVAGALGGAGAALEFGMSYTEFMKEEVEKKGGKFNQEGIRQVLNDPEALQRIRNKAAARGLAIGMIDAMTAGVAGKAIGLTGKALAKGTEKLLAAGGKGTVTRAMVNKGIEISAGMGVEIVGGSLGETAAIGATNLDFVNLGTEGQKFDVAQIGLEGFAGAGNAPITLAKGVYTTPRYKLNGDLVTKNYILATIGTATPAQIAEMNIDIKHDSDIKKVVTDLKAMSQFEVEISETTNVPVGPDMDALIKLEIEKSKLPDSRSETTRLKRDQINQQIKSLVEKYDGALSESVNIERDGNTFTENLVVTRQDAIDQLALEGETGPSTSQTVYDKQRAMMEELKNSDQQAENAIAAEEETKKFQDNDVVLKKETFTVNEEGGGRVEITVRTYLDGSLSPAESVFFDAEGNQVNKQKTKLGDNDIIIKEGLTAEERVRAGFEYDGDVVEKTSEISGNEVNNPKKTAQLTTDQKQKLGIETETETETETKRFQDEFVVLKEETFTITDEDGGKQEVTVRTYLDGSLGTGARVKNFSADGTLIDNTGAFSSKLADNDIIVRDRITAEQQVESVFAGDGYVMEKTSEISGSEVNNSERMAGLTTDQKQKLGIETETTKTKEDAVQKSETKSLDVQEQTRDGQGVGESNVNQETTEVGQESQTQDTPTKEQEKKVEGFTTKRQKQPGRYRVPGSRSVDIEVSSDGTISAVERKTGRPLDGPIKPAVQEYILENIIDVNDGAPLNLDESTNLTPEQYTAEIAENSNNIKEIAETIDTEQKRSKELSKSEQESLADPLDIKGIIGKITEEDYARFGDRTNINPQMRRFWFKKKNKYGQSPKSELDVQIMELDGYTQENSKELIQEVIDFITANPTGKLDVQTGKPPGLVDLEIKFENLTGLKPTKRNINKVLSIDPNREPLVATKQRNKESNQKAAAEPGKFGKKRGPSPKKITGQTQSKIEVDESSALKSQIKLEAKAAKQSENAYRKAANKVAAYIKDIKAKGKISNRQAKLLLAKTLRTKLTDAKQVEKLNTYLTKVLVDASISERLFNAKKKQSQIDKNIKKGLIGSENNALVDVLQELGKTDLSSIPLNKLDAFESLMNTYGVKPKRGALNIKTIGADTQTGLDILNSLEQTEVVEVAPKQEKEAKEYDLVEAITEIQTTKANLEAITDKESKLVADQINDFTREDIESLIDVKTDGTFDYSQLEQLRGVKQNLAQGIVTPTAMNLLTEVNSNKAAKKVSVPISKVTLKGLMLNLRNVTSAIKTRIKSNSPSGKNILLDKVRSGPAAYIDNAFGNFNSKTIYENTFGKLAQVYERFTVDTKKDFGKIEAAERILEYDGKNILRRKIRVGTTANKIVAKKYKIRLLQLAREHILNIDKNGKENPVAPSAKKMIDATLKFFKDTEGYENDFKILNKIAKKFTVDGEISLDKLEKSLTTGEKKALKIYDDINASLASKAKFTSAVLRSNRIDLLNGYSHRIVLSTTKDAEVDVRAKADTFANASTKGGTMVERQKGVRPVSFDPSLSAQRGVQETNLDYYMTPTVREVQKTANKVLKNMASEGTVPSVKAAKALQKSLTEILKVTFTETMRDVTIAEEVANKVKRTAYQAILASLPRMKAELISNTTYIAANPKAAARGFTKYVSLSFLGRKLGADILNALGSTETTKLFDPKTISSRMTDMSNFAQTSPKSQRARSAFMNVIGQLLKLGPKQTVGAIDTLASGMIQAPDKALSIPMWYGTFSQTFLNETGIDLSVKDVKAIGKRTSKIQNEDGSIKKEYKKAVERSTRKADQMGTMISSSNNPFKGVIKNQSRSVGEASGNLSNMYRTVNKFMASFSLFEYGTVRNAIGALYRSGDMSRTQASAVLIAATARMTLYPILYGVFAKGFDELFTDAETEEDESDIEDIIMRQVIGTVLQLMTRRSVGNVPNVAAAYGIEKFNELMLGDFREGDYDPFKHSISFSQFNEDDIAKKGLFGTALKIFSGPMGPIVNTIERTSALLYRSQTNKTEESRDKNMNELINRMTLESLGNMGLIPFYKDIRRIVMKDMFEDGVIQRRRTKAKKRREQYLKFLKKNDPEEYRYEIRQDAAEKKEVDRIEADVLDD